MSMQPSVWGSRAPDDGLRGGAVTTTQEPSVTKPDWLWNTGEWLTDPFGVMDSLSNPTFPTPGTKPDQGAQTPIPSGGGVINGGAVSVPTPGRKPDLDTLTGKTGGGGSQTLSLPIKAGAVLAVVGAAMLLNR